MSGLFDTYAVQHVRDGGNLPAEQGITRPSSDKFALRSQQAAEAAFPRPGHLKEEIVPVK